MTGGTSNNNAKHQRIPPASTDSYLAVFYILAIASDPINYW